MLPGMFSTELTGSVVFGFFPFAEQKCKMRRIESKGGSGIRVLRPNKKKPPEEVLWRWAMVWSLSSIRREEKES